jgi:hypothetical protein
MSQVFDGHETMAKALYKERLAFSVADALGTFVAQMHGDGGAQENVEQQGARCEEATFRDLLQRLDDSPLRSDMPLLLGLASLRSELADCATRRCHGNLLAQDVRVNGSSWIPVDGGAVGWRWRAAGAAAADMGSLLASFLMIAIDRSYAPDAPLPPAPTWPPTPLSERSSTHRAAHALWAAYAKQSTECGGLEEAGLLRACAGFAGCLLLLRTLDGTMMLEQQNGPGATSATRCAINVGRELVLHSRDKLSTFNGVLTILDCNTLDSKHKVQVFSIFED